MIGAGLGDIPLNVPADDCLAGLDPVSTVVDDLLIDADVTAIDGPGGTLAVAGPCYVRSTDGLPLYGVMQFDSADLAFLEGAGQLSSTVVHEMAHVLGFGTLWDAAVLTGAGGPDPVFTGPTAVGAWQGLGRTGPVPVENLRRVGHPRTPHWRESVLRQRADDGLPGRRRQSPERGHRRIAAGPGLRGGPGCGRRVRPARPPRRTACTAGAAAHGAPGSEGDPVTPAGAPGSDQIMATDRTRRSGLRSNW